MKNWLLVVLIASLCISVVTSDDAQNRSESDVDSSYSSDGASEERLFDSDGSQSEEPDIDQSMSSAWHFLDEKKDGVSDSETEEEEAESEEDEQETEEDDCYIKDTDGKTHVFVGLPGEIMQMADLRPLDEVSDENVLDSLPKADHMFYDENEEEQEEEDFDGQEKCTFKQRMDVFLKIKRAMMLKNLEKRMAQKLNICLKNAKSASQRKKCQKLSKQLADRERRSMASRLANLVKQKASRITHKQDLKFKTKVAAEFYTTVNTQLKEAAKKRKITVKDLVTEMAKKQEKLRRTIYNKLRAKRKIFVKKQTDLLLTFYKHRAKKEKTSLEKFMEQRAKSLMQGYQELLKKGAKKHGITVENYLEQLRKQLKENLQLQRAELWQKAFSTKLNNRVRDEAPTTAKKPMIRSKLTIKRGGRTKKRAKRMLKQNRSMPSIPTLPATFGAKTSTGGGFSGRVSGYYRVEAIAGVGGKASSSYDPKAMRAVASVEGWAGVKGTIEGRVSGKMGQFGSFDAQGKATAFAGASAKGQAVMDLSACEFALEGEVFAGARANVQGAMNIKMGKVLGAGGEGNADVMAGAQASSVVKMNGKGVAAGVSAFAGVQATAEGGGGIEAGPFGARTAAGVGGMAGVGVIGNMDCSYKKNRLRLNVDVAASLGVGLRLKYKYDMKFPPVIGPLIGVAVKIAFTYVKVYVKAAVFVGKTVIGMFKDPKGTAKKLVKGVGKLGLQVAGDVKQIFTDPKAAWKKFKGRIKKVYKAIAKLGAPIVKDMKKHVVKWAKKGAKIIGRKLKAGAKHAKKALKKGKKIARKIYGRRRGLMRRVGRGFRRAYGRRCRRVYGRCRRRKWPPSSPKAIYNACKTLRKNKVQKTVKKRFGKKTLELYQGWCRSKQSTIDGFLNFASKARKYLRLKRERKKAAAKRRKALMKSWLTKVKTAKARKKAKRKALLLKWTRMMRKKKRDARRKKKEKLAKLIRAWHRKRAKPKYKQKCKKYCKRYGRRRLCRTFCRKVRVKDVDNSDDEEDEDEDERRRKRIASLNLVKDMRRYFRALRSKLGRKDAKLLWKQVKCSLHGCTIDEKAMQRVDRRIGTIANHLGRIQYRMCIHNHLNPALVHVNLQVQVQDSRRHHHRQNITRKQREICVAHSELMSELVWTLVKKGGKNLSRKIHYRLSRFGGSESLAKKYSGKLVKLTKRRAAMKHTFRVAEERRKILRACRRVCVKSSCLTKCVANMIAKQSMRKAKKVVTTKYGEEIDRLKRDPCNY